MNARGGTRSHVGLSVALDLDRGPVWLPCRTSSLGLVHQQNGRVSVSPSFLAVLCMHRARCRPARLLLGGEPATLPFVAKSHTIRRSRIELNFDQVGT